MVTLALIQSRRLDIIQAALDNWLCTLAMTRREYQGQGTMSALFRIVFDKVLAYMQSIFQSPATNVTFLKATVAKHRIRLSTTIDGNVRFDLSI